MNHGITAALSPPSPLHPARLCPALRARLARRRGERGAAVFVVVLLITMLLGIGIFAARSASLATAASGHERQMTQAEYIAEYGILLSRAELDDTTAVQAWRDLAAQAQKPTACYGQDLMDWPRCAVFCSTKAEAKLLGQGQNMFETWSLGSTQVGGIFCVQLTDWTSFDLRPSGSDYSLRTYSVTATSIAVIRAKTPDAVGWSTSTEMSRARFVTVPIAGK